MKKTMWIIIIALIILAGVICAVVYDKVKKAVPNTTENTDNINSMQENNNLTNIVDDNTPQNEVVQNEIIENEITSNKQEENKAPESDKKTEEEKAIEIVKKDYKQSGNVEFSSEGTDSEGNNIVVVRDPETTQALAFYYVNISNSTFTKKEMN